MPVKFLARCVLAFLVVDVVVAAVWQGISPLRFEQLRIRWTPTRTVVR